MCNSCSPSILLLFFSLRIISCQYFLIFGRISCLIEKVILLMSSRSVYPCQLQLEVIPKPWQNVSGLCTSSEHKEDPFFHNFHQDTLNLGASYVSNKQADIFSFSTFWWFLFFWYIYKRYLVSIINFMHLYSINQQTSLVFTWRLLASHHTYKYSSCFIWYILLIIQKWHRKWYPWLMLLELFQTALLNLFMNS